MKKIIILCFIIISAISSYAQNTKEDTCYFPLAIGNKWQYRIQSESQTMWPAEIKTTYSLKLAEITDTSTYEGYLFYFNSPIGPANYNPETKVVRYLWYSTNPSVTHNSEYWDFSKPVGWSYDWNNMISERLSFFDREEDCLGRYIYFDSHMWDKTFFMNNIGMISSYEFDYAGGGTPASGVLSTLIGCILADGTVYVDSAKPVISFLDVSITNNNLLRFNINHKYSANDPNFDTTKSYTYIDYAKIYYYYSNGSDSTQIDSLLLDYNKNDIFSAVIPKWSVLSEEYKLNYRIVAADMALIQHFSSYPIEGFETLIITGINDENTLINANQFALNQNYPNPFNPSTTINFSIPNSGNVELIVYDILGKEITTLINEELSAGTHSVQFNGSSVKNTLSSGIYFYSIKYNGVNTLTKKMILAK
ncbi:MAG: T9SS type A sorting domain-containing protein [bacterium]